MMYIDWLVERRANVGMRHVTDPWLCFIDNYTNQVSTEPRKTLGRWYSRDASFFFYQVRLFVDRVRAARRNGAKNNDKGPLSRLSEEEGRGILPMVDYDSSRRQRENDREKGSVYFNGRYTWPAIRFLLVLDLPKWCLGSVSSTHTSFFCSKREREREDIYLEIRVSESYVWVLCKNRMIGILQCCLEKWCWSILECFVKLLRLGRHGRFFWRHGFQCRERHFDGGGYVLDFWHGWFLGHVKLSWLLFSILELWCGGFWEIKKLYLWTNRVHWYFRSSRRNVSCEQIELAACFVTWACSVGV